MGKRKKERKANPSSQQVKQQDSFEKEKNFDRTGAKALGNSRSRAVAASQAG